MGVRVNSPLVRHGGDTTRAQQYLGRLDAQQGDGQRNRVQYLQACAELAQWECHQEEASGLAEVIGLAEEWWQIQLALGDLDQSRGEPVLADQAYNQAVSVFQELAEKIEHETLQTRFLTTPRVQRVLEQAAR